MLYSCMVVIMIKRGVSTERFENIRYQILGDVALDVVESIKERCLQWIGRERKLTLTLTLILNTNPKH